jgi:hypothetical protein
MNRQISGPLESRAMATGFFSFAKTAEKRPLFWGDGIHHTSKRAPASCPITTIFTWNPYHSYLSFFLNPPTNNPEKHVSGGNTKME